MNNLEKLHFNLKIEFVTNHLTHTITMNQKKYFKDVLKWFDIQEYKLLEVHFNMHLK